MNGSESPLPPTDDDAADDQATEYALPLVIRLERSVPPTRTDAMETAARAVLALLADPRTTEETGEWHKRVLLWEERAIRKVVRRARGAEWRRASALPGLTATGSPAQPPLDPGGPGAPEEHAPAQVRVFPPVPVDAWPKDLARLQVSGTDFEDPQPPPQPAPGTPVLWLNPALEMTAGKAMAQAGHAAQLAWWALGHRAREEWAATGFPLAVRAAHGPAQWATLTGGRLPVVRDAGFTEVAPGSCTAAAEHPAFR